MNQDNDPEHFRYCPHCGKALPHGVTGGGGSRTNLFLGIALIAVLVAFLSYFGVVQARKQEPLASAVAVAPVVPPERSSSPLEPENQPEALGETRSFEEAARSARPRTERSEPEPIARPEPELDYDPIEFVNPEQVGARGERPIRSKKREAQSPTEPKPEPELLIQTLLQEDFASSIIDPNVWRESPPRDTSSCPPWVTPQFGALAVGLDEGASAGNDLVASFNPEGDTLVEFDYKVTHFPVVGSAGAYIEVLDEDQKRQVLELNLSSTGEVRAIFTCPSSESNALYSSTIPSSGRVRFVQEEGSLNASVLTDSWQSIGSYPSSQLRALRFSGYASGDCPVFQVLFDNLELLSASDAPKPSNDIQKNPRGSVETSAEVTLRGRGDGPIEVVTNGHVEALSPAPEPVMGTLPIFEKPIETGTHTLTIVNPNDFPVRVGVRVGKAGHDVTVRPESNTTLNITQGLYTVYFYDLDRPQEVYRATEVALTEVATVTLGEI